MKLFTYLFLIAFTLPVFAQTTQHLKIAQRTDDYINAAWQGKDSIRFGYNAFGKESNRIALSGSVGNNWDNSYRTTSGFDASGNITSFERQNWINNSWQKSTKYTYAYNLQNMQTEVLYQTWNTANNTWGNTGRILNTYNGGNLTKIETFQWTGSWLPTTLQNRAYNTANQLINQEFFFMQNNTWEKQTRRQYQYAFGFVSSIIHHANDGSNAWKPITRSLRAINGSANPPRIASVRNQIRNDQMASWVDDLKTTYSYQNNLLAQTLQERYDTTINSWHNISIQNYTYNTNNLLVEFTDRSYNNGTNNFDNTDRYTTTYDANNQKDVVTYYKDASASTWIEDSRKSYSYNSNDSLVYLLEEDYLSNSFAPSKQHFYYYNNLPVGLQNEQQLFANAFVYPNPASSQIRLHTEQKVTGTLTANIYSTSGKIISSTTQTANTGNLTIDINNLAQGNYILQLTEIESGKTNNFIFVKQ